MQLKLLFNSFYTVPFIMQSYGVNCCVNVVCFRDGQMVQRFEDDEFEQFKLTQCGQASFPSARQKLLCGLLSSFDTRFQDMDEGLLHATSIANISKWPRKGNHEG